MEENTKQVLRAQFDGRTNYWKIVTKTYTLKGDNPIPTVGWRRFGESNYVLRRHAEVAIKKLVADYPNLYLEE